MSRVGMVVCAVAVAIGDLAMVPPIVAQDDCSFHQCALRVRYRWLGGPEVVQGIEEQPVGRYNLLGFAPEVPMLANSGDSIAVHYEAFRRENNSGVWLEIAGAIVLIAGAVVVESTDQQGWGAGLVFSGTGTLVWGALRRVGARDRLDRAIFWYNGSLRR